MSCVQVLYDFIHTEDPWICFHSKWFLCFPTQPLSPPLISLWTAAMTSFVHTDSVSLQNSVVPLNLSASESFPSSKELKSKCREVHLLEPTLSNGSQNSIDKYSGFQFYTCPQRPSSGDWAPIAHNSNQVNNASLFFSFWSYTSNSFPPASCQVNFLP